MEKNSKPRKPITKSRTEKVKKEPKVTTLLGLGALAVLVVIICAVVLMMAVRGGEDSPKTTNTNEQIKDITSSEILDVINLALFSEGLGKSSFKEKMVNEKQVNLVLDIPEKNITSFSDNVIQRLEKLGFSVEQGDEIEGRLNSLSFLISFAGVKKQQTGPKIAFVIDDCGYDLFLAKKLSSFRYPLTLAVLPHLKYSTETAQVVRDANQTLLLHQPMQPKSYPDNDPGEGAMLLNMPEKIMKIWLDKNVEDLGKIDGFNNHMGSAMTESRTKMRQVFKHMSKHTDFFLDSYTTSKSVAYDECLKAGLKCAQNRKFIDNELDYNYIRSKIIEGVEIARKKGYVIMIGHLKKETVNALETILPELEDAGYTMVSVKELTGK